MTMDIALVRIDDRLIHGQVVIGWIPHLQAQVVVVACDAAAADATQIMLMEMAMPEEVALLVLPVTEAARRLVDCRDRRRAEPDAPRAELNPGHENRGDTS